MSIERPRGSGWLIKTQVLYEHTLSSITLQVTGRQVHIIHNSLNNTNIIEKMNEMIGLEEYQKVYVEMTFVGTIRLLLQRSRILNLFHRLILIKYCLLYLAYDKLTT